MSDPDARSPRGDAASHDEKTTGGTDTKLTSAEPHLATPESFPFPYPKPYDIQLDLMRTVFTALEDRKIAIVSIYWSMLIIG